MAKKSVRAVLRYRDGDTLPEPGAFPIGPTKKSKANHKREKLGVRLEELQERLYAENQRAVLVVLQGMDTSGKGGTISHVAGLVNPQGLHVSSFKAPTEEERAHDFLWRIRKQAPEPGRIGVFDRSHYEDVLIARVDELVPPDVWSARFSAINAFEEELSLSGITVVKCLLHISARTQAKRLRERLMTPEKQWKYDPADVDSRLQWAAYEQAYADVLQRCSTASPWYVVPSDHKWYRNWAVAEILAETLEELNPQFPAPTYDVNTELERLAGAVV